MCGFWYMICNVWYTIYDNWIGGCGSAHSHGHINLFSTIYNISYHHPIATHHRWQWPQFFLTSSSYFLQSNSTPSDRFSTLKVSWHANPPILSHCPNIQRVSLGQLHLEIRSVKGESTLLPLILKLTVVALGFPSRSFQKKSTNMFIKHPVETSNFDLQEISVEGWSGPAILLSRNILLVCTQRCPQLYTHRDPAIWQKSYWLFHIEGDAISRGGSTLLQSSSDSQSVLYWHRSPTHPGWHVHVLPSLTPWSPHTLLGFDILSSFSKCKISAHLVLFCVFHS